MQRPTRVAAILVVTALAVTAASAAPAGAETETPTSDGNGTVGTVVEVTFDGSLSPAERQRAVDVVEARLNATPGYSGDVETADGRFVVRVRPAAPPAVVDRLLQRGNFTMVAQSPDATATLLSNADVVETGEVQPRNGVPVLPVRLSADGAGEFSATLKRLGFATRAAVDACEGSGANASGYCLSTRLDGRTIKTAGVTSNLVRAIGNDVFNRSRAFVVAADRRAPLLDLKVALAAEPLPADATAASVENVTEFGPVTPTGTSTPATETPAAETPTTGAGSPGFTVPQALIALLALVAVAQRVRS